MLPGCGGPEPEWTASKGLTYCFPLKACSSQEGTVGKLLRHLHLKVLREGLVVGLILGRQLGQEFLISNSHVSVKPLGTVFSLFPVHHGGRTGKWRRRQKEEKHPRPKGIAQLTE